jgi:hypothetical protein
MRLTLALASKLTDAAGHNEKARPYPRGSDRERAMVSQSNNATGAGVEALTPVITPTHPGVRTQLKRAISLSSRSPSGSRHGAGNEYPPIREASSGY